jgi:pilus assembly protein Flp/PilA
LSFWCFWGNGYSLAIVPKIQPVAEKIHLRRLTQMKGKLLQLAIKMQILLDEDGQDLIEYALVVALIAFAATAGMSTLATSINAAFTSVGTTLSSYIT